MALVGRGWKLEGILRKSKIWRKKTLQFTYMEVNLNFNAIT